MIEREANKSKKSRVGKSSKSKNKPSNVSKNEENVSKFYTQNKRLNHKRGTHKVAKLKTIVLGDPIKVKSFVPPSDRRATEKIHDDPNQKIEMKVFLPGIDKN